MQDDAWGGGYPVSESYLETAQPHQAPATLDLALLAAGIAPPGAGAGGDPGRDPGRDDDRGPGGAPGRGFRYAELGCGTGFTLVGLAALHPEGRFLGVDFMPEHVARARRFAAEAGLANIEFAEAAFEDLVAAPPPGPFDIVVLHGVWTWVSERSREHLAAILARWLAPGGVLCNGYAAAAGWPRLAPIRRIFREAPRIPGRPPFEAARAGVQAWLAAGGGDATAAALWERFARLPDAYLAHDLAAPHAAACWMREVEAALAPAKMRFAAPADLWEQFDVLRFEPPWLDFVRRAAGEGWGEAARDLACARAFRADLFDRGAPRLPAPDQRARLGALNLAPWTPLLRHEMQEAEERRRRPGFGPETAAKVAAGFAGGPATLDAFVARSGLADRQGVQAALIGLARREMAVVAPPKVRAAREGPMQAYLDALRARLRRGDPVPGAASPALGAVVPLTAEEAAALDPAAPRTPEIAEGLARLGLAPG